MFVTMFMFVTMYWFRFMYILNMLELDIFILIFFSLNHSLFHYNYFITCPTLLLFTIIIFYKSIIISLLILLQVYISSCTISQRKIPSGKKDCSDSEKFRDTVYVQLWYWCSTIFFCPYQQQHLTLNLQSLMENVKQQNMSSHVKIFFILLVH